jgi:TonB-linked SusC/RagA family outer membrane protein
LTSIFGEYEFSPAFKFKSTWSIDYTNLIDDIYFSPLTTDAQTVNGKAKRNNFDQTIWLAENIFTYKKTFKDKHSFNVVFGNTLQDSKANFSSISGQGFPMGSDLQNVGSASILTKGTAYKDTWALSSYIARANYNYLGKYLVSLSARLDGSSRFIKSNRWGIFPAISAGWRINQEKFFPEIRWLTDLKLRGSYGYTGDQNEIGNFQYKAYWQPTQYNGQSGLMPRNLANPNLGWQRNNMANIGIDYELFRGTVYGSVEYYVSNKTKLLAEGTIPATSGFNTLTQNSGKIRNSGFEMSINYNVVHTKRFNWLTNINVSQLKSIVKDWVQDSILLYSYLDLAPTHIIVKGQPFGSFWGAKFVGVNPENGDALFENKNGEKVPASEITPQDYQIIGKAQPSFFGGWNNSFKYKKWDLLLNCSFSIGNQVYNLIRPVYQNGGWANEGWDDNYVLQQTFANNAEYVKKRWKNPGDITNIPRASLLSPNYIDNSSMFLENASFFRIRTFNIGYNLIFKNKKFGESVRIYAQAQNLLLLTKYTGYDPEVSANGSQSYYTPGIDYATYPQAKTFTFGFNYAF